MEQGPYPHCLPRCYASYNLLASLREEALTRFNRFSIKWFEGTPDSGPIWEVGPTTNLISSQVQCVNSLLSFEMQPERLLAQLRTVEPSARKLAPIYHGTPPILEGHVAFEWIGQSNYLGERVRGKRVRGSLVTSADALIVVEREDSNRTALLIEWKFTENYDKPVKLISSRGTDRREIYRPWYDYALIPFIDDRPLIDAFFFEPHYQLLRQCLLASRMLEAGEHGVDRVIVLYLAPAANQALMNCVPDTLKPYGKTVDMVWKNLVPGPKVRFVWQETKPWLTVTEELKERYGDLFKP